jgi:hypothetical protein
MSKSQECRNVLGGRDFFTDLLADRSHGFVRDAEVTCHATQSFTLGSGRNLAPVIPTNARSLGRWCIAPYSRWSPCPEHSLWIQTRDEWQRNHVYLA